MIFDFPFHLAPPRGKAGVFILASAHLRGVFLLLKRHKHGLSKGTKSNTVICLGPLNKHTHKAIRVGKQSPPPPPPPPHGLKLARLLPGLAGRRRRGAGGARRAEALAARLAGGGIWRWVKMKPPGDRRFWSFVPTRVSFWLPVFDPQPFLFLV